MPNLPTPASFETPGYPPATISHEPGQRLLHLGSSWVQGAMSLRDADELVLEYLQLMMIWMLFAPQPSRIAQLGLGSGALSKFCYRHFPAAEITAVEYNPNVIAACRQHFCLPADDARLRVWQMDAAAFVQDPQQHGQFDILQVDVYDQDARGPALGGLEFYQHCHACLKPDGLLTVNIFGGQYDENLAALQQAFDAVVWLPAEKHENLVVLAFKQAQPIEFAQLFARAAQIHSATGLRAKRWVLGLQLWMLEAQDPATSST